MKVGLYLMTSKALPVLQAARASGVEIAHVTTAPATGMQDDSHRHIAAIAKRDGIPTFTRSHPPEFTGDWSVAAGWRWMLDRPRLIVIHDSYLPRYRGFSPMITALVKGDRQLGASAFLAEGPQEGFDTGPIIEQRKVEISYPIKAIKAIALLEGLYGEIATAIFAQVKEIGWVRYVAQEERRASYSIWRDHHDFRIDWTQDDHTIVRLIDAASFPFSGAWTKEWATGSAVTIHEADILPDVHFEQRHPGKVWQVDPEGVQVVCGSGMIRIVHSTPDVEELRTRFR